ncbi:membrane protein, partial [Pseudomonas syringae pv. syringae FF5]
HHGKQGARLALIALAVLSVISGAGLAFAAMGDGQAPVNVFWALGSLLGLNLVLLLTWALGLIFAGRSNSGLGRVWLWLSEKLARDAQAAQLAPALVLLL